MGTERNIDLEASPLRDHILEWKNLSLCAPNSDKVILYPQSGSLRSGEVLAIMGPSGAGKTSFLDVLSQRVLSSDSDASITFDGQGFSMQDLGSYVAQEDTLHGFLTVKDNVRYSALLSLPHDTPTNVMDGMVKNTLRSLGLTDIRKNRIGTYFQRGVSGGQKRRVTIASSVVTQPRIFLCDEPTSGLDSMTGYQVACAICLYPMSCRSPGPYTTLDLNYSQDNLVPYFTKIGYPCPPHRNPADHVTGIINTDFDISAETGLPNHERIQQLAQAWIVNTSSLTSSGSESDERSSVVMTPISPGTTAGGFKTTFEPIRIRTKKSWGYRVVAELRKTWILTQRTALIIRRNYMLSGLRVFVYGTLWNGEGATSVLLATVWLHMGRTDDRVNDRISVQFFSIALLSGMSVSAVPLYLEERPVVMRERRNGLYGAGAYTIASTVVFIPYLFACSVIYSCISYWAIGLKLDGWAFWRFISYLFLGMQAAEAQLVWGSLRDSGWCATESKDRKRNYLKYFFFKTFAFSLLVQNDLEGETFTCATLPDGSCHCSVPSSLIPKGQCALTGGDILKSLDIPRFSPGSYVGALLAICVVYRLAFYVVLVFRK
ncbi:hypothetical protein BS47DRAFT_1363395 [Hydnum rufescens UP504]|uniref:ABC transporter domain-containing protein n=1 Tax=Hydnum rufescens UP504 TaxID=1448309 RepID=A0A9P6AUF1_9AGAM|nr:hypothetical protein BS47DRAFT_1363395 [Hydnum rufescens UP504]